MGDWCPENDGAYRGELAAMHSDDLQKELIQLREENDKLRKALELYSKERERFKHNYPEITGEYFLAGGQGETDKNLLPRFVRICPAYGAGWEQLYERTNRTVSYEGS